MIESDSEDQVCHTGRPPHQRIGYTILKNVCHPVCAGHLMCKDGGRTLAFGATHFAPPHADSFTQTARRVFETSKAPFSRSAGVPPAHLVCVTRADRRKEDAGETPIGAKL